MRGAEGAEGWEGEETGCGVLTAFRVSILSVVEECVVGRSKLASITSAPFDYAQDACVRSKGNPRSGASGFVSG